MSIKRTVEQLPGYNQLVLPWHWLQAFAAGTKYHWPAKHLKVIGVTGTNGKTTTCFMIWKMLNHTGYRTGLLTTVGWGIDDSTTINPQPTSNSHTSSSQPSDESSDAAIFDEIRESSEQHKETYSEVRRLRSAAADKVAHKESASFLPLQKQVEHMTTEKVGILNERIQQIAAHGAEYLVLEVTSHALSQFRTLGIPIDIAVFTNLTHEHLDYHKTFANYRKAKLKLFQKSKYGVINADDKNAEFFTNKYSSSDVSTYGIWSGDYRATGIKLNPAGVEYSCGDIKVTTQIPGKFNVYNSLAALAVGKKLGLTDAQIAQGIASLTSVEGRMHRISAGQDFEVIVDYAHTPDALEKVFESVGKSHRIISVHGGAGRRDESTREIRGEILGQHSDIVIITEDDSRDENPAKIADDFIAGAEKSGKTLNQNLFYDPDRRQAITHALQLAQPGDLVLLLGKGHEKTILRADGPHEFEDVKVATELLQSLPSRSATS